MRILYFSRAYSSHDHRFLTALSQAGEQVYYLTLERKRHVLEDRALPPAVDVIHWKGGQKTARLADGPALVADFGRVLRMVKPDIVQAGPIQTAGLIAALAGANPLLSMSWGYDLLVDAEKSAWWRRATRYTLRRSAAFLGDCRTIRDRAVQYGMDPDRIVTFPWGIDLQHFHPAAGGEKLPSPAGPFKILSTRSWEPIYGVETIVKAFIAASRQRTDLHLAMLSNGSLAGRLRRMVSDAGMEDRAIFPGQVSFQDLPRHYRSADLYVSASHSDGTSISLLEALACGIPAAVSDIPGNREWITGGEAGWTFPVDDPWALEQIMVAAAEDRTRLQEMGRQARSLAEARADWEQNFPKLYEAYSIARKER